MTPLESLQLLLLPAGLVLLLNGICAVWLLVRELSTPPLRWRARLIIASLALLLAALLECITGYYLAILFAGIATCIVAIGAYYLAMFLLLFGKRVTWHLNRVIAIVGICTPILTAILLPGILLVGLFVVASDTNKPVFCGRVSPTVSYKITADEGFNGGTHYSYAIYRNPHWLPVLEKKVANGPTLSCDPTSQEVGVRPGKNSNSVSLWCRSGESESVPQEIPLR
jgi:hypothetical protein